VNHTNCYVIGHREALVVDPGSSFPRELDRLRRVLWRLRGQGGRVAAVLLTHHHKDHIGGALTLCKELDAPLAGHPETLSRLILPGTRPDLLGVWEGHRFRCDGLELDCIPTPGHAPGHLCLFEPRHRVLLGGDMVPGEGTTLVAPPEGDMAVYLESLRRLLDLRPRELLPAHGPPIADGEAAIRRLIAHRLWREQRILDAVASGGEPRTLGAVIRLAYDDVPPWVAPLAARSAEAHLLKLERDGRVRRTGQDLWTAA
jgi:glyoxylase-like metal-dependent hydrolase (beta-lactamase superfamily II)